MSYPTFHTFAGCTLSGTSFFTKTGIAMLSAPDFQRERMGGFLDGFDAELEFDSYMDDLVSPEAGTELAKAAGQLCYLSFGPKRTPNSESAKYHEHIRAQGHGSVLEHANYSFLLYGVSRSFTHELVRHRVGIGYSQVSQRYVSGKTLRFVERPEYQDNIILHRAFEKRIDAAVVAYDTTAETLKDTMFPRVNKMTTEQRKAVNQAARSVLPNETEAPIIMTANVRTLRHIIEMRGSRFAEPEIRRVAILILKCMQIQAPDLFSDYVMNLMGDGSYEVETSTRKI